MLSLLRSRKGQFFILSAVTIVTILFFVSRWIEPIKLTDTSSLALADEGFTFDNIKDKAANAVKGSGNCNDLNYNVQEYKRFVERYALDKNYKIVFDYSIPSCTTTATVNFHIKLHSERADAESTFFVNWP